MFDVNQTDNLTLNKINSLFYNINENFINIDQLVGEKNKLSHSPDDIIFDCTFNKNKCNLNNFTWYYDKIFGICYVFNSGYNSTGHVIELESSYIEGIDYGLKFDLYIGFHENLTRFNSFYENGLGAIIRIGNSSYLIENYNSGIRIQPGYNTFINIDRSFEFIMTKPYSNCDIDNESPKNLTRIYIS